MTETAGGGITPNMERNIHILPPEEARRIAAGEVIDRPSALVREFLDNAIDAESPLIELFIEEGGIRLTEVVDSGAGMGKEDLELCWLTHATSKIHSLDDLLTTRTLGFRGEALAAAAAVSRLEILSSKDGREAWKLSVGPGEKGPPVLEQSRRVKGTSVRAFGLYDTIPARRRFLKRPGSEAAACRQVFNEKALAFPGTGFRFTRDGIAEIFLPPVSSLGERFAQIFLQEREGDFLHEIAANGPGFSVSIVVGGPELSRRDRRLQFVYANKRRIQDFSLLQALEYGVSGWFPNGTHPLGAVFVDIAPSLADFNIHPAKREARFADSGAIHHAVSGALRDFCRRENAASFWRGTAARDDVSPEETGAPIEKEFSFADTPGRRDTAGKSLSGDKNHSALSSALAARALLAHSEEFSPLPGRGDLPGADALLGATPSNAMPSNATPLNAMRGGVSLSDEFSVREGPVPYKADRKARWLGNLFGLFILVEKDDRLFIIDQHAAHERILYDRFIAGPVLRQELLVSIPFSTGSAEDDSFLEEKREEMAKLGIVIRRHENEWLIEALPSNWKLPDRETVAEIISLKNARENLAERWAAVLACRGAVKDGDYLDEKTALALAEEAFALPVSRCPHGRPIWYEISRQDLLKAVKRV